MSPLIQHRHVEVNSISMHVASAGDVAAPPLVLLHGFPEGWMSWREVMEILSPRFRVFAPDLRGYGMSSHPDSGYDLVTLSDDIQELISALKISAPWLVGQDWGGALTWVAGHRYPEMLQGLVVVNCPHPRTLFQGLVRGEDWQRLKSLYMAFFQTPRLPEWLLTCRNGVLLRHLFQWAQSHPYSIPPTRIDELVTSFRNAADMAGPINYYRQAFQSFALPWRRAHLDSVFTRPIGTPVTLVWGTRDRFLSQHLAQQSGQDAQREISWRPLHGVGHFVSLEAPGRLADEIYHAVGL